MTDWADEIVEKCRWLQGSIGALEMARQLRKAKAGGMRLAADLVDCGCKSGDCWDKSNCFHDEAVQIRAQADKIEKGEA